MPVLSNISVGAWLLEEQFFYYCSNLVSAILHIGYESLLSCVLILDIEALYHRWLVHSIRLPFEARLGGRSC